MKLPLLLLILVLLLTPTYVYASSDEMPTVLIGIVSDATTGIQIHGATVEIHNDALTITTTTRRQQYVKADSQGYHEGYYAVEIPPGTYNVTISTSGYITQTKTATIAKDSFTHLYFDLQPIDSEPPTITIYSPTNNTYSTNSIDLSFSTSDTSGISWTGYSLNDAPIETSSNTTLDVLTDGQNHITVYANDTSNNIQAATVYFSIDTTPPLVTLSNPTNGSTINILDNTIVGYVSDEFEIKEITLRLNEILLDSWSTGDSLNKKVVYTPDSWNTINITATDINGNTATRLIQVYVLPVKNTRSIEAKINQILRVDFQEEAKTVIEFVSKKEAIIFINATVSTNASDLNATPLTSANGLAENQTSLDILIMYDISGVDAAIDLPWILINISYDDSDLDRNGDGVADINENALILYWYCEDIALCPGEHRWFPINKGDGLIIKGGPEVFDTGVNKEKNYIWANISHFSKYGLVGEVQVSEDENIERTSSVGSGGGGGSVSLKPTFLEKWKDKIIDSDEIVNIMEYTTSTFKIKYTVDPRLAAVYSAKGESVVSKNTADLIFTRTSALSVNPKGDVFELASKFVLEKYGGPKKVVIARGDLEADSIVASTFAKLIGAPILLVKPDEIPYATQKVLEKYQVYLSEMYIIGGSAAVSEGVEDELKMYCLNCRTFERIWGKTRYETSIEVAKRVMGLKNTGSVMITDGQNPVVYSASLAAVYDAPIIYVDQHSPKSVDDFIAEHGFDTVGRLYYSES